MKLTATDLLRGCAVGGRLVDVNPAEPPDPFHPLTPSSSGVPPFVLVTGPQELLAERAITATLAAVREFHADVQVIRLDADPYETGALRRHAEPSLFGGAKALVLSGVERAGDDFVTDLLGYLANPAPEVTVIAWHAGGNRAKKVLDGFKTAKARLLTADAVRSDRDKYDFAVHEFRRAGRKATPGAVRALQEAVGRDVRELAAACQQLIDDCEGTIDEEVVGRYHGGKVDATGFRVADAAVSGNVGEALRLLRHALATGLDPVPIVAVLAGQVRQMVRVGSAGRVPSAQLAKELGMAPWQVDKARRALQGWEGDGLGLAVQALAAADFDVKGGGRDPVYAVERAILQLAAARRDG